jgi:hypothetical protein
MIAVRSLRLRLMLLYTIGGFIVLVTLALIASVLVLAYLTRPLAHEFATAVARVEANIAMAPAAEAPAEIVAHMMASPQLDGVAVIPVSRDLMASPRLPSSNIDLGSLFGLGPVFVHVRDAGIVVIPDHRKVDVAFQGFYVALALSFAVALVLAVAGARFGTRATLLPLTTVTAELKRFAGGDFTPRSLQVADSG